MPKRRSPARKAKRPAARKTTTRKKAARSPIIVVRGSKIHGKGVFATRRIPKGSRIIEYKGRLITEAEADKRYGDDELRTLAAQLRDAVAEVPDVSEVTLIGGRPRQLSVTIDPAKAKVPGSVGDYGWGGAYSTIFTVDPVEDLVYMFFTQLLPSSAHPIRPQFKQMVFQALVD